MAKAPVISIIDDDESVREATKSLIKSLGYSATTFSSAEEYLRSGDIWESACVITDLHMPGLIECLDKALGSSVAGSA